MQYTNKLSEALDILGEECAEVIQASSKIKRFGLMSRHDGLTNQESLIKELGDLMAMVDIVSALLNEKEISDSTLGAKANSKISKQILKAKQEKLEKLKTFSNLFISEISEKAGESQGSSASIPSSSETQWLTKVPSFPKVNSDLLSDLTQYLATGSNLLLFSKESLELSQSASVFEKRKEVVLEAIAQAKQSAKEQGNLNLAFEVYTDGGCGPRNPGLATTGVCIAADGRVVAQLWDYLGAGTNQTAEILAATQALELFEVGDKVILYSDSQYVTKGLTEWRSGWVRRGWKNSQGDDVANKELWIRLFSAFDNIKPTVRWCRGHDGNPLNEKADQLATAARDEVLGVNAVKLLLKR